MTSPTFLRITGQMPFVWFLFCYNKNQSPSRLPLGDREKMLAWTRFKSIVSIHWNGLILEGIDVFRSEWKRAYRHVRDERRTAKTTEEQAYSLSVQKWFLFVLKGMHDAKKFLHSKTSISKVQIDEFQSTMRNLFDLYLIANPSFAASIIEISEREFKWRMSFEKTLNNNLLKRLRIGLHHKLGYFVDLHRISLKIYINEICNILKHFDVSHEQFLLAIKQKNYVSQLLQTKDFSSALNNYLLPDRPVISGLRNSGKPGFSASRLEQIISGIFQLNIFEFQDDGQNTLVQEVRERLSSKTKRGRPILNPTSVLANATAKSLLNLQFIPEFSTQCVMNHAEFVKKNLNYQMKERFKKIEGKISDFEEINQTKSKLKKSTHKIHFSGSLFEENIKIFRSVIMEKKSSKKSKKL